MVIWQNSNNPSNTGQSVYSPTLTKPLNDVFEGRKRRTFLHFCGKCLNVLRRHLFQEFGVIFCMKLGHFFHCCNMRSLIPLNHRNLQKRSINTYVNVHFSIKTVSQYQMMGQFQSMRLHRMSRSVIKITFISYGYVNAPHFLL